MDKHSIVEELSCLVDMGKTLLKKKKDHLLNGIVMHQSVPLEEYVSYRVKVITIIKTFLNDENEFLKVFILRDENNYDNAKVIIETLESLIDYINRGIIQIEGIPEKDPLSILNQIFLRFHKVAKQLKNRHSNRETLSIKDEYDTQDLLHSLLRLYFDDIRDEEWTPSYAGGCSRVDFLLKQEKIVIEVKKTRDSMTDRDLGDQLIIDVDRYKSHPDCSYLVCFVYDPDGKIDNPYGIVDDLNKQHEGFANIVIQPI